MNRKRIVTAAVALATIGAAIATAATALGGGGGTAPKSAPIRPKPHVDIDSLPLQRGLPADPAERTQRLRKEVLMLSFTGLITQRQVTRALRELRETGTLGGHLSPAAFRVSTLSTLPAQAQVPDEVQRFLAQVGELTNSGVPDAGSVRLLRRDLGQGHGDVYAFRDGAGTPCFILTGYAGTCAGGSAAKSGLTWIVGGGHDGLPDVFVGLAADDVQSIQLRIDGSPVPVTLQNSVAFAELPAGAQDGFVSVTRDGGHVSLEQLPRLDG